MYIPPQAGGHEAVAYSLVFFNPGLPDCHLCADVRPDFVYLVKNLVNFVVKNKLKSANKKASEKRHVEFTYRFSEVLKFCLL